MREESGCQAAGRTLARLRMGIAVNRPLLVAALLVFLLVPACGDGAGEAASRASIPRRGPLKRPIVGQEIWISYFSPHAQPYGRATGRPAGEAKALADELRARVRAGEDIGALAREYSNAPFAAADGFTGVLPRDEAKPTVCDRALASLPVGGVSEVMDFRSGYWFGARIGLARAAELEALLIREQGVRARFRSIALLYRGAWLADPSLRDRITLSKEEAVAKAQRLLERLAAGDSFDELARRHSQDATAKAGGVVSVVRPGGKRTSWVRRQETQIPKSVLDVVFETRVGRVHPEVIVSPRGVFLVLVEERKVFPPGKAP